jgi:addiction module HigA family antidote
MLVLRHGFILAKKTHFSQPGGILKREFLNETNIRPGTRAREIGVDHGHIKEIIKGRRQITADTALRLAKFLETTPEFWMNAQAHYDLATATHDARRNLARTHPFAQTACA